MRQTNICSNLLQAGASPRIVLVAFKEDRIQKDGSANKHSLLSRCSLVGKSNLEGICFSKQLRRERLGRFDDLAQMRDVTVRVSLLGIKDPEWNFATNIQTPRALRATVDATPSATGRGMNLVDRISGRVFNN